MPETSIASTLSDFYAQDWIDGLRTLDMEIWAAKHLHQQARKDFPATPTWNKLSDDYRNAFMIAGKHAVSKWPIAMPKRFRRKQTRAGRITVLGSKTAKFKRINGQPAR